MSEIPTHLGLILDGNRRWARAHNLPTFEGHRSGYNNLKKIIKAAIKRDVKYISVFIFSIENWNRTKKEVKYLMDLAYKLLSRDVKELNEEGIRVLWLGQRTKLSPKMLDAIDKAEKNTANNRRGTLCLCFNYGGRQEIVDAAKKLLQSGQSSDDLSEETFAKALYAPQIPPIDLIIRTSGEQRLSGFMLWRAAYAELKFVDKHWPDFTEADLDEALADYASRHRRFGS